MVCRKSSLVRRVYQCSHPCSNFERCERLVDRKRSPTSDAGPIPNGDVCIFGTILPSALQTCLGTHTSTLPLLKVDFVTLRQALHLRQAILTVRRVERLIASLVMVIRAGRGVPVPAAGLFLEQRQDGHEKGVIGPQTTQGNLTRLLARRPRELTEPHETGTLTQGSCLGTRVGIFAVRGPISQRASPESRTIKVARPKSRGPMGWKHFVD